MKHVLCFSMQRFFKYCVRVGKLQILYEETCFLILIQKLGSKIATFHKEKLTVPMLFSSIVRAMVYWNIRLEILRDTIYNCNTKICKY